MKTLISAVDLQNLQAGDSHRLLVADVRFSLADKAAGHRAWQESHIAGAHFFDMEADLSAGHVPGKTGRHPLPEKQQWLQKLKQVGLQPDTLVVAYDDSGGAGAARLWWMLRWAGHTNVAVLDGGWQAWLAAGGQINDSPPDKTVAGHDYSAEASAARLAEAHELNDAVQNILDARELARFEGRVEPIDPVAGHIPGASCLPFTENLDSKGLFKSAQALKLRFAALDSERDTVCYCGSGVTACHNILAMVHAGLAEPQLYAGSWSEWITDPGRPVVTSA